MQWLTVLRVLGLVARLAVPAAAVAGVGLTADQLSGLDALGAALRELPQQ